MCVRACVHVCARACSCLCFSGNGRKDCHFFSSSLEGLSLLGAYEDSDDEEAGDSTANFQRNQSTDIDSTLANFMAVSINCSISQYSALFTGSQLQHNISVCIVYIT